METSLRKMQGNAPCRSNYITELEGECSGMQSESAEAEIGPSRDTVSGHSIKDADFEKKKGKCGFTLMELLVVISIISLLMSIMLPGLNKSREQAQRVHCGANQRNLIMVWTMYSDENEGDLCSADTDFNILGANNWVADGPMIPTNAVGGSEDAIRDGALWTYTKMIEVYKCKTDDSPRLRSYAISRAMNGKTCNCEHDNIKPFRGYTSIKNPTAKMVFIDATAQTRWIEGSFCPIDDVEAANPIWYQRPYEPTAGVILISRSITARHNDGCNISFVDGHYEYLKWKDGKTARLAYYEIEAIEASYNNADLADMVKLIRGM